MLFYISALKLSTFIKELEFPALAGLIIITLILIYSIFDILSIYPSTLLSKVTYDYIATLFLGAIES